VKLLRKKIVTEKVPKHYTKSAILKRGITYGVNFPKTYMKYNSCVVLVTLQVCWNDYI